MTKSNPTTRVPRSTRGTRWSVLFSSKDQTWATPRDLFHELNKEFGFTIDVCALPENATCPRYYTPEQDGLMQDWRGEHVWCNPPYNDIAGWLKKADESRQQGALVVMLIPARTDTRAWQDHAMNGTEVRFIRGRLKFGNSNNTAPFPSAIVIFRPPIKHAVQLRLWEENT